MEDCKHNYYKKKKNDKCVVPIIHKSEPYFFFPNKRKNKRDESGEHLWILSPK